MFYRLSQALHRAYFHFRTRKILHTPPLPCDPGASCSLHTMLSARDVPMYLPAIKSFLRYCPGVAVVVHSDGSLDDAAVKLLSHHVRGVRVILPAEADEKAAQALGTDSFLFRWRSHDASYRRAVDTELWCTTPKRIIMDSDVLVVRRPEEIIDWIESGSGGFLFGQPPEGEPPGTPANGRKPVQTVFREKVPQLAARLGLPANFPQGATAGFYGCEQGHLTLERIEQGIRAGLAEGVPMEEWGSDQCVVLTFLAASGARRLCPRHYLNYDPGCDSLLDEVHALHFYGTYRYHRHLYTRLAARVAAELGTPSRREPLATAGPPETLRKDEG